MEILTDIIITRTLFIPASSQLIIKNCTVKISKDTHIICLGKFEATNVCFEPIDEYFGAIAILGYNKKSSLHRCSLIRGGGIKREVFKNYPIFWEIFSLGDWECLEEEEQQGILETKIAGGLICVDTKVTECLFEACSSSDDGGSVFAIDSFIYDTKFIKSYSKGNGGAIVGNKCCQVQSCSFVDCTADNGGAISGNVSIILCLFQRCYAKKSGGAIDNNDQTQSNSIFIGCKAENGGAIADANSVYECTFKNCVAKHGGGALTTFSKTSSIVNSKFINCKVERDEDECIGDAIYAFPETIILNCTFKSTYKSNKSFIHGCSVRVIHSHFISKYQPKDPITGCCQVLVVECSHNREKFTYQGY